MRKRAPGLTSTRDGEIVSDIEVIERHWRKDLRQRALARAQCPPEQVMKQTWQTGTGIYVPEDEEPTW